MDVGFWVVTLKISDHSNWICNKKISILKRIGRRKNRERRIRNVKNKLIFEIFFIKQ
jgi:hypothetical protein